MSSAFCKLWLVVFLNNGRDKMEKIVGCKTCLINSLKH